MGEEELLVYGTPEWEIVLPKDWSFDQAKMYWERPDSIVGIYVHVVLISDDEMSAKQNVENYSNIASEGIGSSFITELNEVDSDKDVVQSQVQFYDEVAKYRVLCQSWCDEEYLFTLNFHDYESLSISDFNDWVNLVLSHVKFRPSSEAEQ